MPNSNWSNSSAPVSATAQITDLASLGGSWVPGTALSATTGVFSGLLTAGAGLAVTGAATFSSSVSMGALGATSGAFTGDVTISNPTTTARISLYAVTGQVAGYYGIINSIARGAFFVDGTTSSFGSWNSSGTWIDSPLVWPNSANGVMTAYRPVNIAGANASPLAAWNTLIGTGDASG